MYFCNWYVFIHAHIYPPNTIIANSRMMLGTCIFHLKQSLFRGHVNFRVGIYFLYIQYIPVVGKVKSPQILIDISSNRFDLKDLPTGS